MSFERSTAAHATTDSQDSFWHKVDRELNLVGEGFKAIPGAAKDQFSQHPIETGAKFALSVGLGCAFAAVTRSPSAIPKFVQAVGIGLGVASIGSGLSRTGSALVDNWNHPEDWNKNVQVMQNNFAPFAFDAGLNMAGSLAGGWAGQKFLAKSAASEFLAKMDPNSLRPAFSRAYGAGTLDSVEAPAVTQAAEIAAKGQATIANAAELPDKVPQFDVRNLGWKRFEELDWVKAIKGRYPEIDRIATHASTYTGFDNVGETTSLWEKASAAERPFIQAYFAGKLRLEELSCALSGAGAGLCDKRGAFLIINDLLGRKS